MTIGIYFVPGIGQVDIAATGAVIITGLVYNFSQSIYVTVVNWIANNTNTLSARDAKDAANSIPVKLKANSDHVNLNEFKDKNGKTPNNKNSGKFVSDKDSRYTIEKDTAGHTGYDGSAKRWKINFNDKRIGSLNDQGKVIGK